MGRRRPVRSNGVVTFRLAALWLRWELRRGWRPLILLVVLVAVSAGTLMAAVAGARRGASAADRLVERTLPATAVVRTNQEQIDYWPRIRALPGVDAVSLFAGYSGFGVDEAPADTVGVYLPLDAEAMRTVERPVVLSGRLPDPRRADEAVVTRQFVTQRGLGVGDTVTVRLFSLRQVSTGVNAVHTVVVPHPDGPAVRTRIVGVIRSPWYLDRVGGAGRLIPSPGLAAAYPANVLGERLDGEQWGLVRLSDGASGLPRLRRQLSALVVSQGVDVLPRADELTHLTVVSRFEAGCLLGLAGAVLLAAVFLVGSAVSRQVAAARAELGLAIALGATPRQAALSGASGATAAALVGALAGAGLAVAASRWLPFGVAATVEPHPGVDADPLVLGGGVLLVVLATAGWAWLVAVLPGRAAPAPRPSAVARWAAGRELPVPVTIGLRHALDPRAGRGTVPVRSALAGAVVGVLGVVAAGTFAAGVRDATAMPERFGQTHQLVVALGYSGQDQSDAARAERAAEADPAVRSVSDLRFQTAELAGVASELGGDRTVLVFSSDGPDDAVLLEGRPATGRSEIVLTPGTADLLEAGIGSRVPIRGRTPSSCRDPAVFPCPPQETVPGAVRQATLTVTGIGFAVQTEYGDYDSGAWVGPSTYADLFGTGFLNHELLLRLEPGADPASVGSRVLAALGNPPELFASPLPRTERAAEVGDLRVLPTVLGVFLAGLALAATAHVLVVAMRRRWTELAVLRALGLTPAEVRWTTSIQAAAYAVAGLALGVPLGLAAGRLLWRMVSDQTPLAYRAPLPVLLLLLTVPLTLLVAQLLAVPLARAGTRPRPATALRTE
jgi:hypothetical protein